LLTGEVYLDGVDVFLIYTNLCSASTLTVLLMALQSQLRIFMLRLSISQATLDIAGVLVGLVSIEQFSRYEYGPVYVHSRRMLVGSGA
jgi:hypothetical protein